MTWRFGNTVWHSERLRAAAAFAALAALAACSSSAETAAKKAAEAAAYIDGGNAYAARNAARDAVKARDDVPEYWRLVGRAELMTNNIAGAYEAYRRMLELDPADPEALQMTSEIALRAGDTRGAVKTADQLLSIQPGLTRPKLIKGMAALSMGDDATAAKLADEIRQSDPNDEVGKVLHARVLGRKGAFVEAVAVLDNPTTQRSETVLATLVELHRAARNGAALEASLIDLNTKAPDNDRTFDLATVQYKLGKRDAARATILARLKARPNDVGLHDGAFDYLVQRDPSMFETPEIVAGIDPKQTEMRKLGARLLLAAGKAPAAEAVLEPLIGAGTPPDIWALYAVATDANGKKGAEGVIARVLKSDETNAAALLARSQFARRKGDVTAALRDAQQVAGQEPSNFQARIAKAELYRQRGDERLARGLYEELLKSHPANIVVLRSYIDFLRRSGNMTRVVEVARAYTFLNPERIEGWDMRSALCDTAVCRQESADGRRRALADYTPPGKLQPNSAGIFGRL
jgi:predicted Zn-dependent protease